MTPNMQVIYDYVKKEYDLRIGVTNCRKISGSQTWSQHSWSNANDIFTEDKALQDWIAADLKDTFGPAIRNVLTWRYNAAHWNHVHVDLWPKGWLTPPCAGAELRVKYRNGNVTTGIPFPLTIDIGDDNLAYLTKDQQLELKQFLANLDSIGSNVGFVNFLIPWYRKWRSKYPSDFVPAGTPMNAIDQIARTAAVKANARLDKLKDI